MKREDVTQLTWGSMKLNKCVCVCACRLWQTYTTMSVLDGCMKLINHMLSNCVDIPHCVLRSELTTHRAGEIGRPARSGPSRQNPRTAHQNHTHQSPNGHQRGLSQELIPEKTITLFTTKIQSTGLYSSEDKHL